MGYSPYGIRSTRTKICRQPFLQILLLFLFFFNASTTTASSPSKFTYNPMFLSSSFRLLPRCCRPCRSSSRHNIVALSSSSSSPTTTSSTASKNHKLSDTLHSLLHQRLTPVQRIDTHAARFLQKPAFRDFVLKRYDLLSLEAQGEESAIRRVVHARLLVDDELYRQLLTTLASLPDPWEGGENGGGGGGGGEDKSATSSSLFFQPIEEKIYTSSKSKSHLVAALKGRTSTSKAVSQLSANVASLLEKDEGEENTNLIKERKGRLEEMESRLRRFDSLVEVLSAIEARLSKARDEVLARRRRRWRQAQVQAQDQVQGGESTPPSDAYSTPTIERDTNAWGKAVEKEGKQALLACLDELKRQASPSPAPPLLLLTSVTMQSLATDDMAKLRTTLLQTHTHYQGLEWPKAELDGLIVSPSPEAPQILRVLLAIEMKRSLDEVAVDCLKFSLLLEMCRRASPGALKFSSSSISSGGGKKNGGNNNNNNKKTKEGGEWSTAGGYVLDFSSLRLPQDAIYLTKRGGATLRATSKLMLEQVQLQREGEKENESNASTRVSDHTSTSTSTSTTLLSRFYAPDFVDVDEGGNVDAKMAAAEQEREAVVEMLLARFRTHGYKRLQKRLSNVVQVLTGQSLSVKEEGGEGEGEGEGASPALTTVFTLKDK